MAEVVEGCWSHYACKVRKREEKSAGDSDCFFVWCMRAQFMKWRCLCFMVGLEQPPPPPQKFFSYDSRFSV